MTSRRWTVMTLLLTVLVGGAGVAFNVWLDIYGLFRDTHGRSLPIYASETRAKLFLNRHYVPANFDSILIGSSVSDNWPVQKIEGLRVYNESTDGGNITLQKMLVERALQTAKLHTAICVIHPFLTDAQGLRADDMGEDEYWAAFGSISLLQAHQQVVNEWIGRAPPRWDGFGSEEVPAPPDLTPALRKVMLPEGEFKVDEAAFAEYRELLNEMRGRGILLAAVVPPSSEALLEAKRDEMGRYVARMRGLFWPAEPFIDLSTAEYADYRRDPDNFKDGVHVTAVGAEKIVRIVSERLKARNAR